MATDTIRLNGSSYAVMALLKVFGESTPYDLKGYLEKSVENFWPVPHTTFYAEPTRLAAAGYLSERQEAGGRRRKLYALTPKGTQALEDWARDGKFTPPQLRDEDVLKIFVGADPVPLLEARREWHRAKLEELEGYLAESGVDPETEGARRSLGAGITYHRKLLEAVEEFLAGVREGASA